MPAASPDDLFAYLDSLGIAHQTVTHPAVFTVEESRALAGRVPGVHSKNLFLRDKKGTLFLIVAGEDAAIDLKSLHRLVGASGRFRSARPKLCAKRSGSSRVRSLRSRRSTTRPARLPSCSMPP